MNAIDVNQIIRDFISDANTLAEAVSLQKIIVPRLGEPYKSLPLILSEIEQRAGSILEESSRPNLTLAVALTQQKINGNTLPQSQVTAFIDDSLTAKIRVDGLEIRGKAQPNSTVTVEY